MLEPKFWKVEIHESCLGFDSLLANVYFHEDSHTSAREYVQRMRDNQDPSAPYSWIIHDPVLVDEVDAVDYNDGEEFLDHIRKQRGE